MESRIVLLSGAAFAGVVLAGIAGGAVHPELPLLSRPNAGSSGASALLTGQASTQRSADTVQQVDREDDDEHERERGDENEHGDQRGEEEDH